MTQKYMESWTFAYLTVFSINMGIALTSIIRVSTILLMVQEFSCHRFALINHHAAKKKMSPVAGGRIRSEQTGDAKRKFPGGYYREEDDQKRRCNNNVVRQVVDQRPRKTTSKRSERKRASYWKGASWLRDDWWVRICEMRILVP